MANSQDNENNINTTPEFISALTGEVALPASNEVRDAIATFSVRLLGKFARTIAESEDPTEPFALGVLRWYLDCEPAEAEFFNMLVDVAVETGFVTDPNAAQVNVKPDTDTTSREA